MSFDKKIDGQERMIKKFFIFLLILVIGGLLYYFFIKERQKEEQVIRVSGNIEAQEVNIGFKISGKIATLTVQEGDWVEKGTIVGKLDDRDFRHRLELAQASLRTAEARLEKLLAGSRPEEIREAEAALHQAQFDVINRKNQYDRMKALFERGVIPKETLDNVETGYKMAQAQLQRAEERYKLIKEGPRKEEIEEARAQVEQARASLRLSEAQLNDTMLSSPISGIVLVKSAEAGEVVNPGTTVITLADIRNVWLKAYIPETELGRVKWGQEVIVTTDLKPQKEYKGRITFISSQAEFTPKQIQTEKERVTLVYRIKIDIPNPDKELKPGMPADGRILLTSLASRKP